MEKCNGTRKENCNTTPILSSKDSRLPRNSSEFHSLFWLYYVDLHFCPFLCFYHFSISARAVTCQQPPMLYPNSCLISYFNSIHVHLFSIYKPALVVVRPQLEYQLSFYSFSSFPLSYCYDFKQFRQSSTVVGSKVRGQMSLEECKS